MSSLKKQNSAEPTAVAIGNAKFVSRGELLAWLNDLLILDYTNVEQISNGAAICQIFDVIYPGSVQLSKVYFNAKLDYECNHNFKLLENCFKKHSVDKTFDINKLVKGKMQDNLEFLQWVYSYFVTQFENKEIPPYNGVDRRKQAGCIYSNDKILAQIATDKLRATATSPKPRLVTPGPVSTSTGMPPNPSRKKSDLTKPKASVFTPPISDNDYKAKYEINEEKLKKISDLCKQYKNEHKEIVDAIEIILNTGQKIESISENGNGTIDEDTTF